MVRLLLFDVVTIVAVVVRHWHHRVAGLSALTCVVSTPSLDCSLVYRKCLRIPQLYDVREFVLFASPISSPRSALTLVAAKLEQQLVLHIRDAPPRVGGRLRHAPCPRRTKLQQLCERPHKVATQILRDFLEMNAVTSSDDFGQLRRRLCCRLLLTVAPLL